MIERRSVSVAWLPSTAAFHVATAPVSETKPMRTTTTDLKRAPRSGVRSRRKRVRGGGGGGVGGWRAGRGIGGDGGCIATVEIYDAHRVSLRRRVLLLALLSTLALAGAATLTVRGREGQNPRGDGIPVRTLAAPLFTMRRTPLAVGGLVSRGRLTADVRRVNLALPGVQTCVEMRKVSTGEVLYAVDADHNYIPASTLKLLTGAVALEL